MFPRFQRVDDSGISLDDILICEEGDEVFKKCVRMLEKLYPHPRDFRRTPRPAIRGGWNPFTYSFGGAKPYSNQ
ncbi:hypothetical protein HHI36_011306 [Cryptolaemus montrouzieri]|uniref:Uncharacterized protein n=1 Tax=Cryptolaemus montrouzieri TaxID=559131 RepID=A0ABD2MLP4_9CUCU